LVAVADDGNNGTFESAGVCIVFAVDVGHAAKPDTHVRSQQVAFRWVSWSTASGAIHAVEMCRSVTTGRAH
jgi:hypothetical protein